MEVQIDWFTLMTSELNSDPKGITLVELTITMVLIMIITIPLTIFFGSNIRSYFTGSPPPQVKQVLYGAMGEISDYLRESPGITSANSTAVTFLNTNESPISFTLNTLQGVIERNEGSTTTFVPYYNSPGPGKITLNLTLNYSTRDNAVWTSGNTADISAVGVLLTASYDSNSLTLNNTVNLRRRN